MKKFTVEIKVGDLVNVGRFRNVETRIKSIEVDENGQPVILTNKGKKKLFSCRIVKLSPGAKTPKQILMEKRGKRRSS